MNTKGRDDVAQFYPALLLATLIGLSKCLDIDTLLQRAAQADKLAAATMMY